MMLGIDTNVLIRLLVADDVTQTRKARQLVERCTRNGDAVLISLPVLVEAEWVLRSRYDFSKGDVIAAIRAMLSTTELSFEDESAIEEALHVWHDAAAGFVDCLIAAHNRRLGCASTATFDTKALRVPGFVHA
jgi:predicted nucleic-acid-binding protein